MSPAAGPVPGDRAPDFEAPQSGGGTLRLSELWRSRPVVLSFYPRDFSWGCTRQLCGYRDRYDEINHRNAAIVGVSQNRQQSQQRFSDRHRFPFPLVSDRGGTIARRYGVARLGGLLPMPRRVTFVIDREGIVRGRIEDELDVATHLSEALRILDDLEGGAPPG